LKAFHQIINDNFGIFILLMKKEKNKNILQIHQKTCNEVLTVQKTYAIIALAPDEGACFISTLKTK